MKQKEAPTEHNETGCWAMLLKDSSYGAGFNATCCFFEAFCVIANVTYANSKLKTTNY